MKACINCIHLTGGHVPAFCEHPRNGLDIVSGRVKWEYASSAREVGKPCGPDGKLFTPFKPRRTFLQWLFAQPAPPVEQ